ncbi:threonylcarbamoyladenosine tRNA methylthiotransferase MtaB [Desulfacinum hydrothermale DSM 13146]|uniref:tRNA (N(6)-L-threonylcarbamoyladenosine(37)-C(2))-methylthiotransferase n=1 Tax=Desulfacinum hydrothermale DSM 13146 TaxID=1121390 RepID=A0A1W1X4C4_9BACT|nr:tRNA (N(6)-L-threonylcarbamoyladenosine(37)-C(2))-methylthiotransferase MtaB [Desulfacinum hydrothermale]SMC18829.1 threonylcarbamoyladenosine tRNA methylthiotransferase MtaB [Desulfacinum hydrothermale DSM 13146]
MKIALETLGCKVNQYESSAFLQGFLDRAHQVVSFQEEADLYVVHSCAVTSKAAYQTRQLLRRARRLNPRALIAVLGCDAQVDWERLARDQLATHIIGSQEKFRLWNWLEKPADVQNPVIAVSDSRSYGCLEPMPISRMLGERSRAFLKVQDGCNAFCTYCVVPYSRGRSRSYPATFVAEQMERFQRAGYREVVLTGIHLGQWGRDLEPPSDFHELLRALDRSQRPQRVRLSSLESREVTPELFQVLETLPWICPHFHIPLQSGDQEILAAMGRPYTPQQYAETIQGLHQRFPSAALGADVIVGFPGETPRQFQNTYELIQNLPLTYLHVFPFSPRPGTPAAELPGRVVGPELKERAKALRDLARKKKRAFEQRFVGRRLEVLVETRTQEGLWSGTSENYLHVVLPADSPVAAGQIVAVQVEKQTPQGLLGSCLTMAARPFGPF